LEHVWGKDEMSASKEEVLNKLIQAVVEGNLEQAEAAAREAVSVGIEPYKAIIDGLSKGMEIVGEKYDTKEYFLPELLMAGDAMYAGLNVLLPLLPKREAGEKGTVILGVVEGDIHDIGKNIVKAMLTASGYKVIDLGKDVPVDEFIKRAKEERAQVIAMSTLMTPTLLSIQSVEEKLKAEGLKGKVKTIIGGGSVSDGWKERAGSDEYGKDAMEAVSKVKMLIDSVKAAAMQLKDAQEEKPKEAKEKGT
jgi:corrinoid protein of di/trimethylamine methyltransferase